MADASGSVAFEYFPGLTDIAGVSHAFLGRARGIDVQVDRAVALERLAARHTAMLGTLGLADHRFVFADQVHGREIATVDTAMPVPVQNVDGLITADPRVCLGIYVADCCAVYFVEPERRVIALLHSGRKGSELGISKVAIERMRDEFGCDPAKMLVQLSPCIRPPHYEVDFAALIRRDCEAAGVRQIFDSGTCTAANVERYYSYRVEKGRTGRMLAVLALT
jgi:copper oxidase (laccase) domain-containing protein